MRSPAVRILFKTVITEYHELDNLSQQTFISPIIRTYKLKERIEIVPIAAKDTFPCFWMIVFSFYSFIEKTGPLTQYTITSLNSSRDTALVA